MPAPLDELWARAYQCWKYSLTTRALDRSGQADRYSSQLGHVYSFFLQTFVNTGFVRNPRRGLIDVFGMLEKTSLSTNKLIYNVFQL